MVLPSHTPRTNLADSVTNLSTRGHGHTEQCCLRELHYHSLVRFPNAILKRCLLVTFHVLRFKQPSSVSHQPRAPVHGGCHFDRESCFQIETQASNQTFHSVFCSPNCQHSQNWFWMNFRNCFRVRHPFDNVAHIAERYAFSSDFVDIAAHSGFWAPMPDHQADVSAWGLGESN